MRSLSVHLTDLCNSRCSFCVVGSPLYVKDTIDVDQVRAFLLQNANKGFDSVNLHGGEATLHPQFLQILDLIMELGYPEVHLQTNGIRMADRDFAHAMRARGVTLFIVSLHGDSAELHDSQTGSPGGFNKTIAGITNVRSLGATVRTNTVITRQNTERLSATALLACNIGVGHLNFSNLHPVGSATFSFDCVVPRMTSIREHLYPAIELSLAEGRLVTLEGFPYCVVPEYVHLHLNEISRQIKMLMRGNVIADYDVFMNTSCRVLGPPCATCGMSDKCGGVYPEYSERFGWGEFHALR